MKRGFRRRVRKLLLAVAQRTTEVPNYALLGSEPSPKIFPQYIVARENKGNGAIPEGCFSVCVGAEKKRFYVPTCYLSHPLIRALLARSAEEFGLNQAGVLNIPCDVHSFQHVLWLIHTDPTAADERTEDVVRHYYLQCGQSVLMEN